MIRRLLFFFLPLLFIDCSEKEITNSDSNDLDQSISSPLVIYIYEDLDALSLEYVKQVAKTLDYTKIPFAATELTQFKSLDASRTRVVLTNSTVHFSDRQLDLLVQFVAEGGRLIFPAVNEDERAGFLLGIRAGASLEFNVESKGITFKKGFSPQMENRTIYPDRKTVGLEASNFKKDIKVLATSFSNPEIPVILSNKVGKGKVVAFNTTLDFDKRDRGLFFSAILEGLNGVPYPIANASAIFIDDFPKPLYANKAEPIFSELGIDEAQFTMDVWWPDMLKLGDKYDLIYSAYPCFNYNQIKKSPYLFDEWDLHKSKKNNTTVSSTSWTTQQLRLQNVEVGIHGYNHESLLKEIWKEGRDIESAFSATRKKWTINDFGSFPTSYVAPSNEIDSFGLAHLRRSMPEIRYMSTTYTGDLNEGGDREFDVDPYNQHFFDFPRMTSGYYFDDTKIYEIESSYLFTGIWSHFIHPDDVYQLPDSTNTSAGKYDYRNGRKLGWRTTNKTEPGMLDYFDEYINKIASIYPGIRYLPVTKAGRTTEDWRNSEYEFKKSESFYDVEKVSSNKWKQPEYYWFLYLEADVKEGVIKELKKQVDKVWETPFRDGFLLTIKTREANLILSELNDLIAYDDSDENVYERVKEEMLAFQRAQIGIDQNDEEVLEEEIFNDLQSSEEIVKEIDTLEYYVANDQFDLAVAYLKRKIMADTNLRLDLFGDHFEYAGYTENEMASWIMADEMYKKDIDLGLGYHDYLIGKSEYPNDEIAKIWLVRLFGINPEDKKAREQYEALLSDEELAQLYNDEAFNNSSREMYVRYIQYLLENQPDKIGEELKGKNPDNWEELRPLATGISYNYSDRGSTEKALEWSAFSKEIPILTRLQWWSDIEAYENMDDEAKSCIKENGANDSISYFIANAWYDVGQSDRAAFHANQISNMKMKQSFSERINADVRFFDGDTQKYLLSETPDILDKDTLESIKRSLRITENNYVDYQSAFVIDNFDQSNWDNRLSFNLRDKQIRTHSMTLLHSEVSDLNLLEFDSYNISHRLFGASYRFTSNENTLKPVFNFEAGILGSNRSNVYGLFGASIQHSKVSTFKSLSFTFDPVKTGPGLSQNIYKGELIGYFEKGATEFLQPSVSINASSYTNAVSELAFTGRLFFNLNRKNYSRFSPYVEAFGSISNANVEDGNPFWIISDRIYGGGGLAWTYGRENIRRFNARLEGGVFADSYTDYFVRLNGTFSMPISNYTYLRGSFELFNQAQYYSNGFNIGLRHYLRRKRPYYYKARSF